MCSAPVRIAAAHVLRLRIDLSNRLLLNTNTDAVFGGFFYLRLNADVQRILGYCIKTVDGKVEMHIKYSNVCEKTMMETHLQNQFRNAQQTHESV